MKLKMLLTVPLFVLNSAFAGSLVSPELAKPISTWKAFNNRVYKLCKIKNKKRKPKKSIKSIKIYFDNDVHQVSEEAEQKIISSFEKYLTPNVKHVEVLAHADVAGSDQYNIKLSWHRLNNVIEVINQNRLIRHSLNIKTGYFGEKESTAHQRKDRFVELKFIQTKPVTDNIKRIYLVDGSYSMKKRRTKTGFTFDDLRRMDIPKDTIVYVVRDNLVGCNGERIQNYTPEGRTYVREAMGLLAYNMRGKIKLVTFTDGIEPLSAKQEDIIDQFIKDSEENHGVKYYVR